MCPSHQHLLVMTIGTWNNNYSEAGLKIGESLCWVQMGTELFGCAKPQQGGSVQFAPWILLALSDTCWSYTEQRSFRRWLLQRNGKITFLLLQINLYRSASGLWMIYWEQRSHVFSALVGSVIYMALLLLCIVLSRPRLSLVYMVFIIGLQQVSY